MANARKFEFGLSFDPPGARAPVRPAVPAPEPEPVAIVEPEPEEPPPPPVPTFSQEELDAARHQGFLEGRAAGEADAMERTERRLADTVERLAYDLGQLGSAEQAAFGRIERQAAELALVLVKKLFPALIERTGTGEIAAVVADALGLAREQPKLTAFCAPDMLAAIEPVLADTAARTGFEGRLNLRPDPALGPTDCRIEWNDGGLDRDTGRLMAEIEAVVARGLQDFDRRAGSDGAGVAGAHEELR